jgi:glycosyltransferase involved in cell wall biosynthesis
MVNTFYPPHHFGGDAVFVQGLARTLVARGHHVEVVHCEDAFRLSSAAGLELDEEADGVVVHTLRSRWGMLSPLITQQTGEPGLKRRALQRILDRGFDVVNFHNISLIGGPGILALRGAAVCIYTLHEHWLLCPMHSFWKNKKEVCAERTCIRCCVNSGIPPQLWRFGGNIRRALRHVDEVLSPSEYTARQHEEAGLGPVRVLPTYSSISVPVGAVPASKRPRFVLAGRVTSSKGVDRLVEEFSGLPEYDLDVLGTGDLLEGLRSRYASHGWIRFHGAVRHEEMGKWYAGATALILPSLAPEVFPLCVLEAFACGTPAIVSTAGGSPEAVEASGGGVVFRDRESLHAAIVALAERPGLREEMGQLAREAYQQKYTEQHYIDRYLAVIEDVRRAKGLPQPVSRPAGAVST